MTEQAKIFVIYAIAAVILITMFGVIASMNQNIINAQMKMGNRSGYGNMNTSLIQAMITAQHSVGNNSFAIAGFGKNDGIHLAYTVILATPGVKYYNITVDPGSGKVLATEELTQKELEERHLAHSQKVLTEPHLANNTFVH
jgi:hypothetical protein